jgi:hypothetical protein
MVLPAKPHDMHRPIIVGMMAVDFFGPAFGAWLALKQAAAKRRFQAYMSPPRLRVCSLPAGLPRVLRRLSFGGVRGRISASACRIDFRALIAAGAGVLLHQAATFSCIQVSTACAS